MEDRLLLQERLVSWVVASDFSVLVWALLLNAIFDQMGQALALHNADDLRLRGRRAGSFCLSPECVVSGK